MAVIKTRTLYIHHQNNTRSNGGEWSAQPRQGHPERTTFLVGRHRGDKRTRQYRGFLDFEFDSTDIYRLHKAELVLFTAAGSNYIGSSAVIRAYRNTNHFTNYSGNAWSDNKSVSPGTSNQQPAWKRADRTEGAENRIDVTKFVGRWLKKWQRYKFGNEWKPGTEQGAHGFTVRGGNEITKRFRFYSDTHTTAEYHPVLVLTYEEPNQKPSLMSGITPKGTVVHDTPFTGEFTDPNNDRPERVQISVRKDTGKANPLDEDFVWGSGMVPFDPAWTETGGIWTWTVPSPGAERLKDGVAYQWRCRGFDAGDKDSGYSEWYVFTPSGTAPTVALRTVGTLPTLQGYDFVADWTAEGAVRVDSYRVQVKATGALWSDNLWDHAFTHITAEDLAAGILRFPYGGPNLDAGSYVIRVMVFDDRGASSVWSPEVGFTLSVGSEEDNDDDGAGFPPHSTGYKRQRTRMRIVLWANDGADRGPGTLKAIIEDASNVGFSQVVNEGGEFYFTLTATHPQAGECEPWQRHWELQQYRRGNWRTLSAGLLTDFDAGDNDIIVYGYDYMGMLAKSVDTRWPSNSNLHAAHTKGGAKYRDEKISDIIVEQLNEAGTATPDAPLKFFNLGVMQNLATKVSIFSSYKQRLDFIRGLIESYRAGTGVRTRLKARKDPADNDRWEWDLRSNPGIDRDDLRMEYGSTLQNFRIIAMGTDYATRVHGVGTEPISVKPRYSEYPPPGQTDVLTQTFGSLQRVEVWNDINDENDLKRRVQQLQKESSKVGQRIRLAIRVHSVDPFDGYDLTDNVPLDIDRGLVETGRYGSGYWTIWGLEYRLFPDGHDELTWAIKPREDETDPDPDLLPSDPIHQTPEWYIGNGPPVDPETPGIQPIELASAYMYLDMDTGVVYERLGPNYDTWTEQGIIPGDPEVVPPGYPGDGVRPDEPTAFTLTPSYHEHNDGTSEPILVAEWLDAGNADIIGYEIDWNDTVLDQADPPAPIPPDFVNPQSARFGVGVQFGTLSPVIGGVYYGARIRSYDMEGEASDWVLSTLVQASPDDSAPDIPEGVEAVGGYRIVGVTWGASSSSDLSFYEFRYKAAADPDYQGPFKAKSNRVIIDGLLDEVEYEVQCRAVDRSGNVRVSGSPDTGDEVIDNYANKDVGWSVSAFASTTLIVPESVAFKDIVAEFISTGVISADQIKGGDLRLGTETIDGTIRIYTATGTPIGAWGKFGWIVVDPVNPKNAIYNGSDPLSSTFGMFFTSVYDWDGNEESTTDEDGLVTVTKGVESGIATTTWTTAIGPEGINAEAITFGSQFGGNNRLLNAGFELQDFDTATLETVEYTDGTDFDTYDSKVNLITNAAELRMESVT